MSKDNGKEREEKRLNNTKSIEHFKHLHNSHSNVSATYNRKNYEDKKKIEKYKDEMFQGKQTAKDSITGDTLHRHKTPTEKKYKKNAKFHKAEVDHIVSVKRAYEFGKSLPGLKDEDIKLAVNKKDNYSLISKSKNAQKKEMPQLKYAKLIADELSTYDRIKYTTNGIKEELIVKGRLIKKSATRSFEEDLTNGNALNTITNATSINLARFSMGEITASEAAVSIVKDSAKSEISSISKRIGVGVAKDTLLTTNQQIIKAAGQNATKQLIAKGTTQCISFISNNLNVIVTIADTIVTSATKYAKGEISAKEMLIGIGESGASMAFMTIGSEIGETIGFLLGSGLPTVGNFVGMMVGKVVGGAIGYIVGGVVCKSIKISMSHTKRIEELERLTQMYNEFAEQVEQSERELQEYLSYLHEVHISAIKNSFAQMRESILAEDIEGISNSLDNVLTQFNICADFYSIDEFYEKVENKTLTFKIGANT